MIKWSLKTTFIKGAITMDCHHYNTELPERKRGQHLQREERGVIQALKQQGLTQQQLAGLLGVTRQTIISLENDKYNPSILLAHKIAQIFDARIEDIFIFEEEDA